MEQRVTLWEETIRYREALEHRILVLEWVDQEHFGVVHRHSGLLVAMERLRILSMRLESQRVLTNGLPFRNNFGSNLISLLRVLADHTDCLQILLLIKPFVFIELGAYLLVELSPLGGWFVWSLFELTVVIFLSIEV